MQPRVLMIISFFYPHLGGAEQQALQLAEQLIQRGVQVFVLTRKFKGLPAHETVRGVPVYRAIRTLPWGKWFALTYLFSVLWFLLKKRRSYDIIHCHLLQGFHAPAAILMKALFKKKVIIKVGATGLLSDFIMIKKVLLGDWLLRRTLGADRVITVCSPSSAEALAAGFSPVQVAHIPNGVDTACFKPGPDTGKRGNTITFIGRLDYLKGVDVLLQALRKLIDSRIPVHLDILGDGPERNKLEMMSQQLGINDAVTFHGAVHGVEPYLQQATMLVLPSLSEGMPNVVLEAMACGLPVIATRVGGIVDIIADGENGLLVDAQRPDQLYDAMKKLFTDRQLADRLGRQALKTIEQQFSIDTIVNRYSALYQALMKSS
jgi:glycosyltransferase involved in cell wall biosynthesis